MNTAKFNRLYPVDTQIAYLYKGKWWDGVVYTDNRILIGQPNPSNLTSIVSTTHSNLFPTLEEFVGQEYKVLRIEEIQQECIELRYEELTIGGE